MGNRGCVSVRVGVYVDASNVYRSGGNRMRYDVLRDAVGYYDRREQRRCGSV